ncbi:MAG TPA: hypothetical protein PLJ04_01750 [Candidatus Saccharibacteria bacterium]|nr:hypothetical protein [Candidatus Saccharibacteria bacterium]
MSIGVIIGIIVVAVVILVLLNLVAKPSTKGIDKAHFINEWNDIVALSKDAKSRPLSIVHADKLLDEALKGLGYRGETMAERLIAGKNALRHRDDIWTAHKLRNKIVHETAFEPSEKQVKSALSAYHKTFKDLGVW